MIYNVFSQTDEMNLAMDGLNKYNTEETINALALRHFDDQTLIQVIRILILSIIKYIYLFYKQFFKNIMYNI